MIHGSSRTQLPTTFSLARSGTAVLQSGAHCGCRNLLPQGSRILPSLSPAAPRFLYAQRRAGSICSFETSGPSGNFLNEADRSSHVFYPFPAVECSASFGDAEPWIGREDDKEEQRTAGSARRRRAIAEKTRFRLADPKRLVMFLTKQAENRA